MSTTGAVELAWWVKHQVNVRTRVQIPRTQVWLDEVVSVYNPSVRIRGRDGRILGSSGQLPGEHSGKQETVLVVLGGRQGLTPEIAL